MRHRVEAAGAVFGELAGRDLVRHFGDVAAEYRAVRETAGVAVRSDLVLLRMWGRDPVRMLNGLITNDLSGAEANQGVYAAMLTPKGRTVAELRAFRRTSPDGAELLIVLPIEAATGTVEHLKKYVPPLFARWEALGDRAGILGVYGPRAAALVEEVLGASLPAPGEDRFVEADFSGGTVLVVRTLDAGLEDGYDLVVPGELLSNLRDAILARDSVLPIGFDALDMLRIEAGRPRYGAELTEATIPTEAFEAAGLLTRAISFTKGCYTGQEVIVRIAHRGHVNRHLRGLLLGGLSVPAAHTPLYHPETGREIGWTTSAAVSPRLGQTVALAFVRREVEPGGTVRLGSVEGDVASVVALPFGGSQES